MRAEEKKDSTGLSSNAIEELSDVNQRIVTKNRKLELHESLLNIKQERNQRDLALRPLFLNVGMVVSLLFAVAAINWRSYDKGEIVDLGQIEADHNEIIEIPPSTQKPPPPPKQKVFKIAVVKDTEIIEEIDLNLDVEVTESEALEEIEFTDAEIEKEQVDEVFVIVEQQPEPVGGFEAFYTYLSEELNYPSKAIRLGITGAVFVQFIIEKDGSITQVQVVKGIGAGCDEEAIRVIESAPAWNPGKQRGVAVRVKKIIPVRFILSKR